MNWALRSLVAWRMILFWIVRLITVTIRCSTSLQVHRFIASDFLFFSNLFCPLLFSFILSSFIVPFHCALFCNYLYCSVSFCLISLFWNVVLCCVVLCSVLYNEHSNQWYYRWQEIFRKRKMFPNHTRWAANRVCNNKINLKLPRRITLVYEYVAIRPIDYNSLDGRSRKDG